MDALKDKKPSLTDRVMHWGELGFDPELPEVDRVINQSKFQSFIDSTGILPLIPVLNFLIQPGRVPPWLRTPLMSALALLPLRERGVQNTIEFILSVHPSNSGYEGSGSGPKGAGITHEALHAASKLLSTPPAGMTAEEWFAALAPQLFSLLQGEGESGMDKAAAFIIGFGILGRKQYGAPGMPGWKAFVEPMLGAVDPLTVTVSSAQASRISREPMTYLGTSQILVTSLEVAQGLHRLTVLATSHPHPSLTKRLLRPILLPLWSLSYWPGDNKAFESRYRKPARKLLRTFLQLTSGPSTERSDKPEHIPVSDNLTIIIRNLLFNGRSDEGQMQWSYAASSDGGVQIQKSSGEDNVLPDLAIIDQAVGHFVGLMRSMTDFDAEISALFMDLCTRYLATVEESFPPTVLTQVKKIGGPSEDHKTKLVELRILLKMMNDIPEKLVSDSRQVLYLVNEVLSQFDNTTDGSNEDMATVALSLLNFVLTSPGFRETTETQSILETITSLLVNIGKRSSEISATAKNLHMFMTFRTAVDNPNHSNVSHTVDQHVEDRKSYKLAMSYITATDSPPPVRVQGLELISDLIRSGSSVVDVPALIVLFSSLLQDDEEYIYLRAIKSFLQLSERHPKAVMIDLIERYVDPNEDYEIDQRLRVGEALLQVIQNAPLAFTGEAASSVVQGLMSIAGRRGLRPKTEKAQQKQNRLRRKKDQEAENAWEGPVPQLEELLDNKTQQDNEVLHQIVSGWESKRGTEDVRIRSSATSILTAAIEVNITGLASTTISGIVDLGIHILTLEPDPEKGVLRRSAILLILGFIQVLDSARAEGRKLGFGFAGQSLDEIQRILNYVEATDNDGLVRQHARDVVESLQNWQMNCLLPFNDTGTRELAGLSITPSDSPNIKMRPRIEEIE